MKYSELPVYQAWPLSRKIEHAIRWIGRGFEVSRHRQALAFSGGKDSTVLADLIVRHFPNERPYCIFGNTGVEYPESLRFAREYGTATFGERFREARPAKLEREGLKYQAQRETLQWLERTGKLAEVLKGDGKLKSTEALEDAATPEMWADFRARNLVWRKGNTMSYWWCVDQFGFPILGKSKCKLDAHRINIDCFLKYSASASESPELLEYYDLLRQVKISQHCCKLLKKEPSERLQAELDVDVIFKGLMADESRSRMMSYCTRGELFQGRHRDHLPPEDPFWHCNPLGIWTDQDIWDYIHQYNVPYSKLYDRTWKDRHGNIKKVKRNGCFGCATGIAFEDNQIAVLRQIEPRIWDRLMRGGMAEQLQNLRIARANGQLSIMDLYDAPRLPWQDCKQGVKAWTIECAAITNSWDPAAPIQFLTARPRRILFKRDSEQDQYGWSLFYDSVGGGNYFGGWGNRIDVFATQPTEADCERYARARYAKERRVTASTPYRPWTKED